MVNLEKVSNQILNDGLYNTLLFEIKERLQREDVTQETIKDLLKNSQDLLAEYKEINRQSEISNIQIKTLEISKNDMYKVAKLKKEINQNMQILKNLENFERDSEESAYSIWVGSVGVMMIFVAHNIIALFSELYSTHGYAVYGLYAVILFLTYLGYTRMKKNHDMQHKIFEKVYTQTKKMLDKGFSNSYFAYEEVYEK